MFLSQFNAWEIRAAFPGGKRAVIVQRYPVLVCFSCVQCFRAVNSDMDYRILNVRTLLCVRIHTGVGHTDESAQHFDSEKLSQILLVFPTGFEPLVMEFIGSRG